MIDIEFIANQQLTNAELFIAPEIRQFIKVLTPLNNQINSGERTQIKLLLQILATQSIGELEGSIHVRMRNRTVAKPLPVSIRIISADTLTNKVSDFLVKEFGTVLPNLDPDERFLYIPEIPPELVELTGEGTGLPVVFRIGSIIFSSNLSPVFDLEMRGIELIDALDSRGINISILEAALPSIVWNEDIPEKSVIPSNTQAITIFPPFAMFDTDGNFVPDTIVIIPDNTIHIVLKPQDVQDLLANPPIQPGGILTPAGSTALHELIHVHNFQTKCGDAWFNLLQEESFVQKVELLIADVIFGRDTQILTNSAVFVIQQFSRGIDCFEALDLTPPTSVTLNLLTNISTSTVSLSWSQNTDPDFASYKLLRSTSPNVTTNNTLIATITNQNQTSFTDANLTPNTTFFYKLFVFDKAGLSTGSNEVSSATISVPRVPLCPLLSLPSPFPIPSIPTDVLFSIEGPCTGGQGIGADYSKHPIGQTISNADITPGIIHGIELAISKLRFPQDDIVISLRKDILGPDLASTTISASLLPQSPQVTTVTLAFNVPIPTTDVNFLALSRTGAFDNLNFAILVHINSRPERNLYLGGNYYECAGQSCACACGPDSQGDPAYDVVMRLLGERSSNPFPLSIPSEQIDLSPFRTLFEGAGTSTVDF